MNKIGSYKNGNYTVTIFDDGTKIRFNKEDTLIPDTVESMDIKITNYCDKGCLMCHERSSIDGIHGDILSNSFIDRLHPYTELAIGGGNPLSHPDLIPFLEKCKTLNLIPSMTVNQTHFMNNLDLIHTLVNNKLIYGLGISYIDATKEFIDNVKLFDNAVIHIINGLVSLDDFVALSNNNLKILILGYKEFGRGIDLYSHNKSAIEHLKQETFNNLKMMIDNNWFKVISFDNLAIKQLDPKRLMSEKDWNSFYMGDDGKYTMYVDMVNRKFAKNSCSTERFDLLDTIEDMFKVVNEV